jgi:hypothetical protein
MKIYPSLAKCSFVESVPDDLADELPLKDAHFRLEVAERDDAKGAELVHAGVGSL